MDPVTHGIAGALIGKAFFATERSRTGRKSLADNSASTARVGIVAATLGAVFPDVDVFVDAFSHDPLAIARYHRGFTHSFIGLPVFALLLAALTRWFFLRYSKLPKREDWVPPSFAFLVLIYAVGIASHIILDGFTSFGTRMLNPVSKERVAWDFLFIVDFIFTTLLLIPQVAAWVHKGADTAKKRATTMWVFLTVLALAAWALARAAQFPFSFTSVVVTSAIFASLFFLPIWRGLGTRISRAQWCRGGLCLSCIYIVACGFAHHAAISRVRTFASEHRLSVDKLGAMPLPVSLLHWNGLILTADGVYQSEFSLRSSATPEFHFFANSATNRYTGEATQLEPVRTFLWFARFPVMHFAKDDGKFVVEYTDLRFFSGVNGQPMPFTFYVSFDSNGEMLKYGWVERGPRLERTAPSGGAQ